MSLRSSPTTLGYADRGSRYRTAMPGAACVTRRQRASSRRMQTLIRGSSP
jgi:hypothetical protein